MMGARGPAPKPTHLKIIAGNPGGKPLNKREPQPQLLSSPALPRFLWHMHPLAKAEWKRVAPELLKDRLLTRLDVRMLAQYCEEFWLRETSLEKIHKEGPTFTTDKGYVAVRPEVAIARAALESMVKIAAHFGMSPSSRSRIQMPASDNSEKKDELFGY